MAALTAAARGRRTVLLEKQAQPGLKILISGGGRCNLTTTRSGADLEAQYGARRGRFLRHALRAFPPTALRQFVEDAGLPLREEDLEKLFPVSQKARDVVSLLLRLAQDSGVALQRNCAVRGLCRDGAEFVVQAASQFRARSVVLASGGLSYPKTGATGDGYAWCRAFGHSITATYPALAPLAADLPWLRELQGIVLDQVALCAVDPAGKVLTTRRRPILFTHKGLSGPGPMDLAGDVEELRGQARVRFDFAPDANEAELEQQWLQCIANSGTKRVEALLPAHLPERVKLAITTLAQVGGTLANFDKLARKRLLAVVKRLDVPIARSLGYAHAEVTRGGVALDEVDARTMQSKLVPGLFLCGELLDIDGPIGGFNFQAAFATGRLAGSHA